MPTTITIRDVRFSYVTLFQPKPSMNDPKGEPKYSLTMLIPKTNIAALALIQQAISEAENAAVSAKWGNVKPPVVPAPLHDGDGVRQDGTPFGTECKGCWVMTASANVDHAPFVVDQNVQPIIDPKKVYSGCWGNVSVSFFGYNAAGKKGIGCGLNGVQFIRDGEPLGSRITAEDAFGPATYSAPIGSTYSTGAVDPITGQPIYRS